MLWEAAMQPCTLFELKRVSDGEGGFASVYAPSAPFEAAITLDSSTEARIAAKEGAEDRYTVTTVAPLKFHDVFQRSSDGKTFRITSNGEDRKPHDWATFKCYRHSAEAWEVPNE